MADSCLASFPVHFASKNFSHHLFAYSSKPSCACRRSYISSSLLPPHFFLFLGKEKISSFLPLGARTTRGREGGAESIAEHKYVALDGEEITEGSDFAEGDGEKLHTELLEDTKLFVGNLPYDIDSKKLALFFQKVGVVEVAEVIYEREINQSRGFGFVSMSTVEEADRAVEQLHSYEWNGRQLTVSKASTRGGSRPDTAGNEEPSFRIYVGNLPWEVDNASLEQIFSEHGRVLNRRVVYDRQTGRSRGFGFVTMASKTEVDGAIAALDGQSLEGRAIRVNVAEERLQQHQPPQIN